MHGPLGSEGRRSGSNPWIRHTRQRRCPRRGSRQLASRHPRIEVKGLASIQRLRGNKVRRGSLGGGIPHTGHPARRETGRNPSLPREGRGTDLQGGHPRTHRGKIWKRRRCPRWRGETRVEGGGGSRRLRRRFRGGDRVEDGVGLRRRCWGFGSRVEVLFVGTGGIGNQQAHKRLRYLCGAVATQQRGFLVVHHQGHRQHRIDRGENHPQDHQERQAVPRGEPPYQVEQARTPGPTYSHLQQCGYRVRNHRNHGVSQQQTRCRQSK